jgi:hypothetical protein
MGLGHTRPQIFLPTLLPLCVAHLMARSEHEHGNWGRRKTRVGKRCMRCGGGIPLASARPLITSVRPGPVRQRFLCRRPQAYRCIHKKYDVHGNMTTPPAVLALWGWGYAELRPNGVLRSSHRETELEGRTLSARSARRCFPPLGPPPGRSPEPPRTSPSTLPTTTRA